jgi:hypothetical protein
MTAPARPVAGRAAVADQLLAAELETTVAPVDPFDALA